MSSQWSAVYTACWLCLGMISIIGSSSSTHRAVLFVAAADDETTTSTTSTSSSESTNGDNLIHDDTSLLTESEILLKLYDETRGLRWKTNTNWLQNTDVCTWYGITCYDSSVSDQRRVGHVQKIDLSANRLLGSVPQAVFQLPYLESMDVKDNADLSVTFEGIGEAQYLQEIALSNTNVKSLEGIEAAAKQLKKLHITSLGLTGEIPSQIFQLTSLVGLFANYNKFNGSLSSSIGKLNYLTELYLFANDLTGQIPTETGLLSNIEVLTLAENAFSGTLPMELNKCTKLTTLAINRALGLEKGAGIQGSLPSFSQFSDMTDLRLQNQRLSGSIPADFLSGAPRQEVVKVELSGNAITGAVPSSLANFRRLNLFLADNQITSVPVDLCNNANIGGWLGGNVGKVGCDAFLCRPETTASQGRATPDEPCSSCDGAQYWGSTRCVSSPTTTTMGYSEREILVNLYNKMGGRYWKNDDGWLDLSRDICDWYGVECVESKVTGLLLKNNELSNSPPVEIFSLPELKHLDFEANSISFDFKGIGNARKLETLILTNCDLDSLDNIGELKSTSIRNLSLASNDLQGSIPVDIFDIVGLQELDITHGKFSGEIPSKIGDLTNLESLLFSKNKFGGQLPPSLGQLTLLRKLVGSDNSFSGTLPTELESLTRLEVIAFHQATSTENIGGPLLAFPNLSQLTSLQLDSNSLSGSLPDSFLRNTEKGDEAIEVRLSDNKFQGDVPGSWAGRFQSLSIDLSGNQISGLNKDLCNENWNQGNVNLYACDGLLCPPGKFNEFGRQTGADAVCRDCSQTGSAQYFGSKSCNGSDEEDIANQEISELDALKAFFDSTEGNSWKNNAGWMTSPNPCDGWYGVECNADGQIVTLELDSNALVGTPSSSIFQLSYLHTLSLKNNNIVFNFTEISAASNLAVLMLSGTNMDSVAGISKASGLTELHLTDNNLKVFDDEILQLTNLRKLYLNFNSISSKIPPGISSLENLEDLFLFNNRFVGQIPASIGLLTRLKHLAMAENAFTGTLPPELNDLTNLEILSLQREGGTDSSTVGVNQGRNDDDGAGISGPLIEFDNLKYLKKLYLGANSLTGTIPAKFLDGINDKALPIEIDLISNRLTGSIPPSLTEFSDLSLFVAGNQISGIADGLCRKAPWMTGAVALYKCNAILCPPGTYSQYGRQKDSGTECSTCDSDTTAQYYGSFSCLGEDKKQALSERTILEDFFRALGGDNWKQKDSWLDSDESVCSWFGITCISDKVLSIRLAGNGLKGDVPTEIYDLPNLKEIELAQNFVDISFSGVEKASNLDYLKLDSTNIKSLSGLEKATKLNFLHIANNNLASSQFPTEILSLNGLQSLDLSGNSLGALSSLESLAPSITYLACSECSIGGTLPSWLASLTKLEHLAMDGNSFNGMISSLSSLSELKYLNLADQVSNGGDGLGGTLPDFSEMNLLQQLYLQRNSLEGSIPESFLSGLSTDGTVTIDLRANNITGAIPQGLAKISDLDLYLAGNRIDSIPQNICSANWNDKAAETQGCDHILCDKGKFNALGRATLELPCTACSENGYAVFFGSTECGPAFEKKIVYELFEKMGGLNWTHSNGWQDHDDFCSWYGVTCYQGGFRDGFVQRIDLSQNNLRGDVSSSIWGLVHMNELDLRKNYIDISFVGIANAQSLDTLHLSETKVSDMRGIGSAPTLKYLHLTNCDIAGPIPDELFEMTLLNGLYLNYNHLTGNLPETVGQLSQLREIYLFHNALNGTIPESIGLLKEVEIISLGENKFTGPIPIGLNNLQNLRVLSLQREEAEQDPNQFFMVVQDVGLTGDIIPFNNTPKLRELYLGENHLQGDIPSDFLLGIDDSSSTIRVELSSNMLHGVIPASLVRFDDLRLDLTGNSLREIPNEFCSKTEWFDGELATGCDAFLCPPGTFNEYGRRVGSEGCETCNFRGAALFYGSRTCGALYPQGMTDFYMLQEIYESTAGPSWENSQNWLRGDVSICAWYGVTCVMFEGEDHVTELNLSENSLEGLVPSIVFYLPHLKKLDLGRNKVWVDFEDIDYSVLEELFLDKTNVASLDGISNAASLKILDLKQSQLVGQSIPEEFYNMTSLTSVDLSESGISGTLSTKIGNLQKLTSFLVKNNDLSGVIPESIGQLKNLEDLVLSDNTFHGQLPSEINGLTSLKSFFLDAHNRGGAGISGPLLSFSSMPKLRDLLLGGNSFTGTVPATLLSGVDDLSAVIIIDIESNHLTGSIPSTLSTFESLNIYAADNYFTGIGDGICQKSSWLEGAVGTFSCDALLCPAGTYNSDGRQTSNNTPCVECSGEGVPPYMGQTSCLSDEKKQERIILELFYHGTGGSSWKNSAGWLDDDNYCNWYGITCADGGTVESISLASNNLVGTPPEEIFGLRGLKTLWLYSNPMTFSFEGIGKALNLKALRLDSTGLKSLNGIGEGQSLVDIDVRFNRVKGELPNLDKLALLESFACSENLLSGSLPSFLASKKLVSLRAGGNNFSGFLPPFADHSSIRSLDVSANDLSGPIPDNLFQAADPTASIFLDLSSNNFLGAVPSSLSRFTDLTLYLRDNRIGDLPPDLCKKQDWNQGDVGLAGCDGILCPPRTYSPLTGRESRRGSKCERCDNAQYFGSTTCTAHSGASTQARVFGHGMTACLASVVWLLL